MVQQKGEGEWKADRKDMYGRRTGGRARTYISARRDEQPIPSADWQILR